MGIDPARVAGAVPDGCAGMGFGFRIAEGVEVAGEDVFAGDDDFAGLALGLRNASSSLAVREGSGWPEWLRMIFRWMPIAGFPEQRPPPRRVVSRVSPVHSSAARWAMGSASVEP